MQGTREWPVSQTPYLIVYRIKDEASKFSESGTDAVTGKAVL